MLHRCLSLVYVIELQICTGPILDVDRASSRPVSLRKRSVSSRFNGTDRFASTSSIHVSSNGTVCATSRDTIETLFPFSRQSVHAGSHREDARTVTRTVINGTRFLLLSALDTAPPQRPTVDVVLPPFSPRAHFLVYRINDA